MATWQGMLLCKQTILRAVYSFITYSRPAKISGYLKYLLLAGLQLLLTCSIAQQPYSLIHYDENTLPQTTIGNIEQGENGYLWMSTQFGIVRFDGETFRVFTTDNLKGLTSNRIRVCARSFDGSIYFLDENHVIIKVKSPNEFETISTKD
jgi:ligand-binding sensor domain-containing protein